MLKKKSENNTDILKQLKSAINISRSIIDYQHVFRLTIASNESSIIGIQQSVRSFYKDKEFSISNSDALYEIYNAKQDILGYVLYCFGNNKVLDVFYLDHDLKILSFKQINNSRNLRSLSINPTDWYKIHSSQDIGLTLQWKQRNNFKNFTISYLSKLEHDLTSILATDSNNQELKYMLIILLVQLKPTIQRLKLAKSLYESMTECSRKESLASTYSLILDMLRNSALKKPKIVRVNWGIYNRCPITCIGCYNVFNEKVLSYQHCTEILKKLTKAGVQELIISGGDPLLWDHICEFVKYAANLGLMVGIDTVSYNLNRGLCSKLKNYIAYIGIPLDGIDQKTIEKFRRGKEDLHQVLMRNIRLAQEFEIPVRLNTTVHKGNIGDLEDIARIVEQNNIIKSWSLYQWWPLRGNGPIKDKMFLENNTYTNTILSLEEKFSKVNLIKSSIDDRERCTVFISSNGEVYTFSNNETINTIILGNILNDNLEDLVQNPAIKANSKKFLKNERFYNNTSVLIKKG